MKKLWLLVALLVLAALLGSFFLLVNFRVMKSQTVKDFSVASGYNPSDPGEEWNFTPHTTSIYISGDGRIESRVREEIMRSLKTQPNTGLVESLYTLTTQADHPLLLVKVTGQEYFWTPFYARSAFKVDVGYASNGDLSFWEKDPPHFFNQTGQPALQLKGNYAIADKSWGILSAPGYNDYLATQIADVVMSSLREQMGKLVSGF